MVLLLCGITLTGRCRLGIILMGKNKLNVYNNEFEVKEKNNIQNGLIIAEASSFALLSI